MKTLPKKQGSVKVISNKELYKEVSGYMGVFVLMTMLAIPIAKLAADYTISCCNTITVLAEQEIQNDLYLSQIDELLVTEVKKV